MIREDKSNKGKETSDKVLITVEIDREIYKYLEFLENIRRITDKEEAINSALRIFKKLNMQDWFPSVYRMGQERIMLVTEGIMIDILGSMSEKKLYRIAREVAVNRKALDVFDHELNLSEEDNWGVILNEMNNFGWGQFEFNGQEINVEHLILPIIFLKGYLETLFGVEFIVSQIDDDTFILIVK